MASWRTFRVHNYGIKPCCAKSNRNQKIRSISQRVRSGKENKKKQESQNERQEEEHEDKK